MHEDRQKQRFYEAARSCARARNLLIESLENKVNVSYAYLPPMKTISLLFVQKWQLRTVYRLDSKTKAVEGLGTI